MESKRLMPLWFVRPLVLPLFMFHAAMNRIEPAFGLKSRKAKRERSLKVLWNQKLPLF